MSDNSTMFSGASRYASDFEALIERAVAIASLPLAQLQTTKAELEAQSDAVEALETAFTSLQSAITSLETAGGISSYTTSVSNAAIASVSIGKGAMAATYTVEVTSLGSWTSTMSKDGLNLVTDPAAESISSASSFTLTVNGTPAEITPAANTLSALVEAINDAGLDVEASLVNVGSTASPDYRLSIRSTKLDAVTIQLNDGSADLLDTLAAGAKAGYKLNGMATAIQSDSRTVTLAPGVTMTLLGESDPGVTATITVSRSTTSISNALSSFATAYNAVVDELDAHRGQNEGALAGHSIVQTLWDSLRQLAQYSGGPEGISSLTALGLNFDDQGKLSLDTSVFDGAASGNMDLLAEFLGSSSESGFLKYATDLLDSLLDGTDGLIQLSITSLEDQISDQDERIAVEEERVQQVEENLVAQMSAADALIAAMEQQVTYISGLFESMRIASQMYE